MTANAAPGWANWLTAQLERRTMRQKDLAERIGYTDSHMSRVATGVRKPTRDACASIAQVFGVAVEEVWTAAGWDIPSNQPPPPRATDCIEQDRRLTRAQKNLLVAMYESWMHDR